MLVSNCPKCGIKVNESQANCPKCRTNLVWPDIPENDTGIHVSKPNPRNAMPGAILRRRKCFVCGSEVNETQDRCPRCMTPLNWKENPGNPLKSDDSEAWYDKDIFGGLLKNWSIKDVLSVLAALVCLGSIGIFSYLIHQSDKEMAKIPPKSTTQTTQTRSSTPPPKLTWTEERRAMPNIEIFASQLYKEYEANAVAADNNYYQRFLIVEGTVEDIDFTYQDKPYLTLYSGDRYKKVICYGSFISKSDFAKLRKGQRIEVVGYGGKPVLGNPSIIDCGVLQVLK
jgi:hypothetical protein